MMEYKSSQEVVHDQIAKDRVVESSELLSALMQLVKKWEAEGGFLDNPHDSLFDREVGKAYKNCVKDLKEVLGR